MRGDGKRRAEFLALRQEILGRVSRRALLGAGLGLGTMALTQMLGRGAFASVGRTPVSNAGPTDLGLFGGPQLPAKAKRVVSIHISGAMSQIDTFEYKPTLLKMQGQEIPASVKGNAPISNMTAGQSSFPIFPSKWAFKQYGQSATWASELVPYMGSIADDLTFIHTMHTPHVNHDPASIFMHTGFQLAGRPSEGAWINYALGSDNANLPSFIVMKSKAPSGEGSAPNPAGWSSGFLPSHLQGVELQPGKEPVLFVDNPDGLERSDREAELQQIAALSRAQYAVAGDPEINSKLKQYEMLGRMQLAVPEATDISTEPESVLQMYGPNVRKPGSFARNCLLARRLIERGVKFVQLVDAGWDHHSNINSLHPMDCKAVDQPAAALVADLKRRGLLEDTLVTFGSEFGRTSFAQGTIDEHAGRDHHGGNFVYWLAGGGTKPGLHFGQTDDFSYNPTTKPVSLHDLHATLLYLVGFDHTKLIHHYQGRDFRLTDVEGEVVKGILA
jgi:hypothetical protein